jgi:hypothetical protein
MENLIYPLSGILWAIFLIWLPFEIIDNPIVATAINALSLVFAVFAILLNHVFPSDTPLIKKRLGYLILLSGFLGLPWIIIIKITRQDVLVKKVFLFFQLIRLPICDSSRVKQIQVECNISTAFQTWLEMRTLAQVINRYCEAQAVRERNSLSIRPSHRWQSAYFIMSTSLTRIGKSEFIDYSTHNLTN